MAIERVKNELNKLSAADGIGAITVPVNINARLTTTLGRVTFSSIDCHPIKIEFSKNFIDTGADADILNVIKHEYVHYYLLVTTGENHQHDASFKAKCANIGCTHDGTKGKVNMTAKFKYEVWCEDCNDIIGTYSRMCKTIKEIKYCQCGRCGGKKLKVIQNW